MHKHRGCSETFRFFTSERFEETGSESRLRSSREGGRLARGGLNAVFPTQLRADPQRSVDLGDDSRVQTGVFRPPPSEKGTYKGTFE